MKCNILNIISKLFINYKKKIYNNDFYIFPETE